MALSRFYRDVRRMKRRARVGRSKTYRLARPPRTTALAAAGAAAIYAWAKDVQDNVVPIVGAGPPASYPHAWVDGNVDTDNEEVDTVKHGMVDGDGPYHLATSGTLPVGLSAATNYWANRVTADSFAFGSTKENAEAGTKVPITSAAGTGNHVMVAVG